MADEYIRKQDAIEALENKAHLEWGYLRIAMPLLKTLENIPAADVVPVVHGEWVEGEWIYNEEEDFVKQEWICSECGQWVYEKSNFCPNCGADMRGE